jgi:hypothetical protein
VVHTRDRGIFLKEAPIACMNSPIMSPAINIPSKSTSMSERLRLPDFSWPALPTPSDTPANGNIEKINLLKNRSLNDIDHAFYFFQTWNVVLV